jgi:hypothetical protein
LYADTLLYIAKAAVSQLDKISSDLGIQLEKSKELVSKWESIKNILISKDFFIANILQTFYIVIKLIFYTFFN